MRRDLYESDHEAFRESVRAFLDKEVVPNLEQWEKDEIVPRELYAIAGRNGFLGKAVSLFVGIDRMVGGEFEKGLADLKRISEAQAATRLARSTTASSASFARYAAGIQGAIETCRNFGRLGTQLSRSSRARRSGSWARTERASQFC